MDIDEFRTNGHMLVDWMADYFKNIDSFPVKSKVNPGDIFKQLPAEPPVEGEPFERIFKDFNQVIVPGITHWQHPCFFAYFNANNSFPSILAEMLTATLGAQCMIWETSPAAAELEEQVMNWTAKMIGIPETFTGVIQDTASTATLCSLLTAREKVSGYSINKSGFTGNRNFTVYCSSETHSSIEKGVKIAGLGKENLRKIAVDRAYAMDPEALEKAILKDIKNHRNPLAVIATLGTTGSNAIDPLKAIGGICKKHGIWLHVDAAYGGSALILDEKRWMIDGIELADTFVFNPHKWMFTNFDCSAYYVKDREALIKTFEIMPEYLKTKKASAVNNYRDWGIQLGRRFRALKLWFVIRQFGVSGLKRMIRFHLELTEKIVKKIEESDHFECLAPVPLATICFRYLPPGVTDPEIINKINETLMGELNQTGKVYLSHTKLDGKYTIRLVIGQTRVTEKHVMDAWELIRQTALKMGKKQAGH